MKYHILIFLAFIMFIPNKRSLKNVYIYITCQ